MAVSPGPSFREPENESRFHIVVCPRVVGRRSPNVAPLAGGTASLSWGRLALASNAADWRGPACLGDLRRVAARSCRLGHFVLCLCRDGRDEDSKVKRFDIFHDPVLLQFGPVPITKTMATSIGISLALVIIASIMRSAVTRRPAGPMAAASEIVFESIDQLVTDVVGRRTPWLAMFAGSLFLRLLLQAAAHRAIQERRLMVQRWHSVRVFIQNFQLFLIMFTTKNMI